MILCSILILFFSWLLLCALFYSKSENIIEGLDPSPPPPSPTSSSSDMSKQAQIDENTAAIAELKTQIASLISTASQLNAQSTQNEIGITNNTAMIQKVIQSQLETNQKIANMKKAQ
jgi:hypothetical protein